MASSFLAFPAFDPVAISLGPFAIRWYALAYIGGLLLGWWYARRLLANEALWGMSRRLAPEALDDLLVYVALGVVGGGRLAYVFFYDPAHFLAEPLDIPQVWHGGMSFHGGLLGAVVALVLFARSRQVSVLSTLDLVAMVAPIGLLLGRIANFINEELWGRVTDVPWAVLFPHGGPLPRHPSQLYEGALEGVALFLLVNAVGRTGGLRRPGLVTGLFGLGYAGARIFVELFREPDRQLGYLLGTNWLTMGMVLSLPMALGGLWLIMQARPLVQPANGMATR